MTLATFLTPFASSPGLNLSGQYAIFTSIPSFNPYFSIRGSQDCAVTPG